MGYAALSTVQTIATGEVFTAATLQQANDNDEFLIDPPACSIKETTAQAVATGTATALTSDEENYDNDSMHSTVSNTARITIQTAGRYLVAATVSCAAHATGSRVLDVRVNGSTRHNMQTFPVSSGSEPSRLSGIRTLVLSASDYVECVVEQNSGGNLNITLIEFNAMFITR